MEDNININSPDVIWIKDDINHSVEKGYVYRDKKFYYVGKKIRCYPVCGNDLKRPCNKVNSNSCNNCDVR